MSTPTRRPRWRARIGRRGAFLILAAVVWGVTGLQVLTSPVDIGGLIHQELPLWIRVATWWVPAAIAGVYAFRVVDWPGFVPLLAAPLVRAVSYTWAWITWLITDGADGMARGWSFAPASLAMFCFVLLVAGWPEPVRIAPEKATEDDAG